MKILGGVSHEDRLFFTKHLSMMIQAGIPLSEAIETLEEQTKSSAFKKVIASLRRQVENGDDLGKALRKHESLFGELYISLISIGEESGTLEESLNFLSEQMAKDHALRKKVQGAMFYPGLILGATGIMGTFIAFFILPKLVEFFEDFEIELPITTKILIWFAKTMQSYGIIIVPTVIGLIIGLFFLLKMPGIKPVWHKIILKIPKIGNFLREVQLARFTRNMGTMLKSGVPVIEALDTSANSMTNVSFIHDLQEVKKQVEKGKSINEAMEEGRFNNFPPVVSKMIGIGEKTGKLDETLLYLSDYFEEEIDNLSKSLSTIIEPFLLISIGLAVAFIALSIISPIYELTGSIRQQ